jgi:hypothetical protein
MEVKPAASGEGFELLIGDHRLHFPTDPDRMARRLERWCSYFFREFVPQSAGSTKRHSPAGDKLRARETRGCPACGKALLPRRGDVGLAV